MPRRHNDTVWGVAVHWYVDAYATDENGKTRNAIGLFNCMAVARDAKGQPHCGSTTVADTKFLSQAAPNSTKRKEAEKKYRVSILEPCES